MITSIITPDYFRDKVKELQSLTSYRNLTGRAIEVLYEKLHKTDIDDFDKAVDHMAEHDVKCTLANFRKYIGKFQSKRLSKEESHRQVQEKQDTEEFWSRELEEENCDQSCPCERLYCNRTANDTIKLIDKIINKKVPYVDVCRELSKKYPGIGFEEHVSDTQPF